LPVRNFIRYIPWKQRLPPYSALAQEAYIKDREIRKTGFQERDAVQKAQAQNIEWGDAGQ